MFDGLSSKKDAWNILYFLIMYLFKYAKFAVYYGSKAEFRKFLLIK